MNGITVRGINIKKETLVNLLEISSDEILIKLSNNDNIILSEKYTDDKLSDAENCEKVHYYMSFFHNLNVNFNYYQYMYSFIYLIYSLYNN